MAEGTGLLNRQQIFCSWVQIPSRLRLMLNFLHLKLVRLEPLENWQMGIQDPASLVLQMINFYHLWSYIVVIIAVAVCWRLLRAFVKFNEKPNPTQNFTPSSLLEVVWTILPGILIMCLLAFPGLLIAGSLEDPTVSRLNVKFVGHSAYWTCSYTDAVLLPDGTVYTTGFKLDSRLIRTTEREIILEGKLAVHADWQRELHYPHLPTGVPIRVVMTSAERFHTWTIPSLGIIKCETWPGKIRYADVLIKKPCVFYGQCSEIDGVRHSYMPIVVKGVPEAEFKAWRLTRINK